MAKPELTKQLIADTLKKLASSKPLDKIRVGEIVNAAGLNRQTFYYHFQDKQELICWIFDSNVSKIADKNKNNILFDDVIKYIYAEKEFYIAALTSNVQNNLRDHIYKIANSHLLDEILSILGNREMDDNIIKLFARFFTNATVGSLIQWAQEGMKTDDLQFLDEHGKLISELLEFAVNKYVKQAIIK